MSCWPVQTCRGISSQRSPGIIEHRTCGSFLDDEFKWNQLNTSLKRRRQSRRNTWDDWYRHNKKVTEQLSFQMKIPTSEVADLLYNLTLQNYNNILNPKGKGWNAKRVPLSQMYACDRYLNIFDLNGNLRDPRHPRSLILLLQFMQSNIKADTDSSTCRSSWDSNTPCSTENEKYRELYPVFEDRIYFMYSRRLGRLIDPDLDKVATAIERQMIVGPDQRKGSRGKTAPHHLERDFRQRDFGDDQINLPNRIVNLPRPVASSLNTGESDYLLSDEKGRRRGQGSIQLMNLRSKRAEILRHLLQKLNRTDPDRFLKSLASIDLKISRSKRRKTTNAAEELATFYTDVVTKEPKRKKDQKEHTLHKTTDYDYIQKKEEEIAVTVSKERKYFGDPMPVMFHAPYKPNDKSTWLRRYPNQQRMQEDGHVGIASVRRYKRDSIKKSLFNAQQRYSIHSLNSVVNPPELQEKPEFKRIFRSTSRRFKQSKQPKSH